jgi:4-amino-4-deoxy-L-arabinose transferase-like glycosyltransferase
VTTSDWREGADNRPRWLALWLILIGAFILRVFHLGAGIPFAVGIDEPAIMTTVVRILKSGDFNPHFFEYPTGYIYVQLGSAIVTFLFGAMRHSWKAVEQVGPADFYFAGRLVSAAIGTATIALVYQAARRWGAQAALVAAGLMAVMPMHVRESQFALTDVPLTFVAVLTLLLSLRASERPALGAFALAGAAAGLAAGIKYNGLMAVSTPLAAVFALERGHRPTRTAAVCVIVASCVAVFFSTTPFALIDLPAFLNGFGTQAANFGLRSESAYPSWLIYARHMQLAFGWPALVLCLAGLGLAAYQIRTGPNRVRAALLLVFPAVFFYLINGWGQMFARYALPIVPFLAIGGGIAAMWIVRGLERAAIPAALRKTAVAVLIVGALVPSAIGSVQWVRQQGADTTQAQAWKWVKLNIWAGSVVVSEARRFDLPPERFRVEVVMRVSDRDPEAMAAAGVEWVILSSDAWGRRSAEDAAKVGPPPRYAPLMKRFREMTVIIPTDVVSGPEIHILRLVRP